MLRIWEKQPAWLELNSILWIKKLILENDSWFHNSNKFKFLTTLIKGDFPYLLLLPAGGKTVWKLLEGQQSEGFNMEGRRQRNYVKGTPI